MVNYLKAGDMTQHKQHSLLNRSAEACNMLKKHIDEGHVIRVISHNDADGLSAAGVITNAIKEEGGQFHVTIVSRLQMDVINDLKKENYELFVFCDMGSACLKPLNSFKADIIIADHHQPADVETGDNIVHVNPHLFGVDGSRELSGAGSTYLCIRDLDKKHLAYLALVGAFGDMQGEDGFMGMNKLILQDAIESGTVEIHEGLKIASKSTEAVYKSLAYTFKPALPGLTGDLEGSQQFLEQLGLSYGIKFTDLSGEEQDLLKDALIQINPKILSEVYTAPKEISYLQDLEDFSDILDACGKNKKYGLGLSLALGERGEALDTALKLRNNYRSQLIKGMEWVKKEGAVQLNTIQYLYSEDQIIKKVMGTIASVGLTVGLLDENKPVLGLSRLHKDIKVSGRTLRPMIERGVNLGKALNECSSNFGGQGGGHDIAAGAMIPYGAKDEFLHLVDQAIAYQLENNS